MFNELDVITLTEHISGDSIWNIPQSSPLLKDGAVEGLLPGDVGTIVYVQGSGEAFEVEFLEQGGWTVAIATVFPAQMRAASEEDLANDRFFNQTPA